MTPAEKLQLLQADLDTFRGSTLDTRLELLPDWGSLTVLLLIVHAEEKYQHSLAGSQVRACRTVADLLNLFTPLS